MFKAGLRRADGGGRVPTCWGAPLPMPGGGGGRGGGNYANNVRPWHMIAVDALWYAGALGLGGPGHRGRGECPVSPIGREGGRGRRGRGTAEGSGDSWLKIVYRVP